MEPKRVSDGENRECGNQGFPGAGLLDIQGKSLLASHRMSGRKAF